jgi:hypothetical protein
MPIKYVIAPGYVHSVNDGDRHYIGAMQLIRLYGVSPKECRIYEPAPQWTTGVFRYEEQANKGLIWLRPKANGDYSLPIA